MRTEIPLVRQRVPLNASTTNNTITALQATNERLRVPRVPFGNVLKLLNFLY